MIVFGNGFQLAVVLRELGLRSKLVTGKDIQDDYKRKEYRNDIDDLEIPTVPSMLDEISQNLEKIPISDISANINGLLKNLNEDVPALLHQSTAAINSINKLANSISGPGATTISDLNKMIRNVSDAAKSVSRLSDYLERHPEAMLKGKGGY